MNAKLRESWAYTVYPTSNPNCHTCVNNQTNFVAASSNLGPKYQNITQWPRPHEFVISQVKKEVHWITQSHIHCYILPQWLQICSYSSSLCRWAENKKKKKRTIWTWKQLHGRTKTWKTTRLLLDCPLFFAVVRSFAYLISLIISYEGLWKGLSMFKLKKELSKKLLITSNYAL